MKVSELKRNIRYIDRFGGNVYYTGKTMMSTRYDRDEGMKKVLVYVFNGDYDARGIEYTESEVERRIRASRW